MTQRIGARIHFVATSHAIDLTSGAHLGQSSGSSWTVAGTGFEGQADAHAVGEVVEMVALCGVGLVIR